MKKDFSVIPNFEPVTVEINELELDLTNVRFAHLTPRLDEKHMEEAIWDEPSTNMLYAQIKIAKKLYEKPVINSDKVVIEGNRRIVCLRRLQKEAKSGTLPRISADHYDFIDCNRIPPDTPQESIDLYLASIHVKGKQKWPTFNKAKKIYDLHQVHNFSYDNLAKHLGMGKVTVIRMADVYEQTKMYGKRYTKDKEWYHKFTYFDELYKRRDLKDFRSIQKKVDMFANWVHEGKFDDVRDVRSLARVLADTDAFKALERGNFANALKIIEKKNPSLKSKTFRQIEKVTELIRSFPRKELLKTVQDPERIKMLKQLKSEIDALLKDIRDLEGKS